MNEKPKVLSPRVSALINKRLTELNLTKSDFIRKFHRDHGDMGSRNHLFKILSGQAIVGEMGLLPMLCKSLGVDKDEVVKLLRADKIQSKNWASAVPKANKTQSEVLTIMDSLTKRDQEEILMFAQMKAKR